VTGATSNGFVSFECTPDLADDADADADAPRTGVTLDHITAEV
jgi:hypothetical protein